MKTSKSLWVLITGTLMVLSLQNASAQDTLNISEVSKTKKDAREYRNIIYTNVTSPVIFGERAISLGYQRVVNKHQAFSVDVGMTDFPSLNILNSDSLKLNKSTKENGFHISGDYRFYLSKENRYAAPRGIYIGPYFYYNQFKKGNTWLLQSESGGAPFDVESSTTLNVASMGFQLGYQFILWKRLSLDMILFGPGIASYSLKASLGTNLSEPDREKFFEKLNDALAEKFPGYDWVIGNGDFKTTGSTNTTSFGYRYVVLIGYRF